MRSNRHDSLDRRAVGSRSNQSSCIEIKRGLRKGPIHCNSKGEKDSSVEFMGEFRFRELAKCVIEREFGDAKSSEAIGFSHGDFGFVVQTLDHAAGELLFSLEVIEN